MKTPLLYKILVMLLCISVTAFTLSRFAHLIQHLLKIRYSWEFELFMVLGQLLFQFPFIFKQPAEKKLDYFLNMLLVSFIGSVLLWPLLAVNAFYRLEDVSNICYFFTVVFIMFVEHKRRVKKLSLPEYISYTWVLYRIIILIFIV